MALRFPLKLGFAPAIDEVAGGCERLALVEPLTLVRESFARALNADLRGVCTEGYARVEDVDCGPARLALLGVDPRRDDAASLRAKVAALRARCEGAPVGALMHEDDEATARTLGAVGVVGIVPLSARLAAAVGAVQLMMVGGYYLPSTVAAGLGGVGVGRPCPLAWRRRARLRSNLQ